LNSKLKSRFSNFRVGPSV